jgi:hypothetical protein
MKTIDDPMEAMPASKKLAYEVIELIALGFANSREMLTIKGAMIGRKSKADAKAAADKAELNTQLRAAIAARADE